jgi:hypothetical protein
MRRGLIGIIILGLAACDGGAGGTGAPGEDTAPAEDTYVAPLDLTPAGDRTGDTPPGEDLAAEDLATEELPPPEHHPIGMVVPPFALEDLNPTSATYGQVVDSADLAGRPYALIFLDSRCPECGDVADGLWATYEAHPTWWEAQPTFAIQRAKAYEMAPGSVTRIIDDNNLPYLLDVADTNLWMAFYALNHDFFAIGSDGTLEVWLELYFMPEAIDLFEAHMTERYGP